MAKVTDPNVISALNAKVGAAPSRPKMDDETIAALNKKAGIKNEPGMFDKVGDAYNSVTKPIKDLGRDIGFKTGLGDGRDKSTDYMGSYESMSKPGMPLQGLSKNMGNMAMLLGPEVGGGSKIPTMAKGFTGLLKDVGGSMGRVGISGAAGSKLMGGSDYDALITGLVGAGTAAVLAPVGMATSSLNPLVRIGASTAMGGVAGAGAGHMFGLPYGTQIGGVLGSLLGARGGALTGVAAHEAGQSVTPEQLARAAQSQRAAQRLNIDTTASEQVGSANPYLRGMQNEAAASQGGGKVAYPFVMRREAQEETAINKLLEDISPANAKKNIEDPAYKNAFKKAEESGTKVDVKSIVNDIDAELKNHEPNSPIAKALNEAKSRLRVTPKTAERSQAMVKPYEEKRALVAAHTEKLQQHVDQLKANAPNSYFQESSTYTQQLKQAERQLQNNKNLLAEMDSRLGQFKEYHQIGNPYETSLEGLHNAKMGISGLIEGQGDKAIGRTAAGRLKQVNKKLNDLMKDASPEYAEASHISNMRQARGDIENAMAKSNITGSNFYDKVLANRKEYQELYKRIGDPKNPGVVTPTQRALADMREVFPDLMNNISAKAGRDAPQVGTGFGDLVKGVLNKVYMDRYHTAVMELMTNPRWQGELSKIAKLKAGEDRGIRLGRLISSVFVSGGANTYSNGQQGSNDNGSID